MKAPETDGLDENYGKLALRVLIGPKDEDWHNAALQLLDHGPDYCFERGENGEHIEPKDVVEMAGRMLGYFAGLIEWASEEV